METGTYDTSLTHPILRKSSDALLKISGKNEWNMKIAMYQKVLSKKKKKSPQRGGLDEGNTPKKTFAIYKKTRRPIRSSRFLSSVFYSAFYPAAVAKGSTIDFVRSIF